MLGRHVNVAQRKMQCVQCIPHSVAMLSKRAESVRIDSDLQRQLPVLLHLTKAVSHLLQPRDFDLEILYLLMQPEICLLLSVIPFKALLPLQDNVCQGQVTMSRIHTAVTTV